MDTRILHSWTIYTYIYIYIHIYTPRSNISIQKYTGVGKCPNWSYLNITQILGDLISNRYLKVMFNKSPKWDIYKTLIYHMTLSTMDHLSTPLLAQLAQLAQGAAVRKGRCTFANIGLEDTILLLQNGHFRNGINGISCGNTIESLGFQWINGYNGFHIKFHSNIWYWTTPMECLIKTHGVS